MNKKLVALMACAAAAAASPAAAQVSLEANVAKSEGQWGGELGAGYSIISIEGFRVTPGVGVFIFDGQRDGFALDGADRCVGPTGERADKEYCDDAVTKIYGRAEATYTLPFAGLTAGFGGRLMSGEIRPYGTVALPLLPLLNVKGNVGHKYVAAGLNARF
jgi:opacity protein-like surface antigen